jgi:uncharacterized membrane protein YjfL (UPF0719 family)
MSYRKQIRLVLLTAIIGFFFVSYHVAFAQLTLENPISATSVPELVNSIVRSILGMVGALALFMFVYGGMLWMTSAGNTQRIEKGKETLIWATIGLVIIFASYAILSFIFQALSGKG